MENFDIVKREFEPKVTSVVLAAQSITVRNVEDNSEATKFTAIAKSLYDQAETERVKMKEPSLETGKRIDAFFKRYTAPLKDAIAIVKGKQSDWFLAEEQKRMLAEAKAQQDARERENIQRTKLLQRAEEARASGNDAKADTLIDRADNVFVPVAEFDAIATTQKTDGVSSTFIRDIEAIILDPIAVIKEMAAGKYPLTFVKWDIEKVEKYFKSIGAKPGEHIGIRIKPKITVKIGGVK